MILVTIIKILFAFVVVATIHEFGHFIMAKKFGMTVNEFSIGFGPKIWQKKHKDTMYSIRWLPLGGYCALEGEEGESTDPKSFSNKPAWQRAIVLVMGVVFNAILAFILFIVVSMSFNNFYSTKIDSFVYNPTTGISIVEQAGLRPGDEITHINGKKVNMYEDIKIDKVKDGKMVVDYIRDGQKQTLTIEKAIQKVNKIGVIFKTNEEGVATNIIDYIEGGNPANKAGLKAGDKIVAVNGVTTDISIDVIKQIQPLGQDKIVLTIDRNGEKFDQEIIPTTTDYFNIGFMPVKLETNFFSSIYYSILDSGNVAGQIVGSYVDLFTGKVGVGELSGIVGVGEVVSKTTGLLEYVNLLAFISLAIGIANILPFPPLDGGKLVILLIEKIVGKKVSPKVEAIISYIGLALLMGLFVYVTFNDVMRIF